MLKSLMAYISDSLYFAPRNTDGDAAGGTVAEEVTEPAIEAPVLSDTVPQDAMQKFIDNDPEYQEILQKQSGEAVEDGTEEATEEPTEEPAEGSAEEETEEPAEESVGEPTESIEFEDDVIPGLKGKVLASLSPEEQEQLADYYEKAEESKKVAAQAQEQAKLLEDPIIKHRLAMLAGQAGGYAVTGLSDQELSALADKHGFTMDEVKAMVPDLEKIVQGRAENLARNITSQELQQRKAQETNERGRQLLLGLGKFNKTLESDITPQEMISILEKREAHPKWEKWSQGVGKIYDWARSKGFTYQDLTDRFSDKALYAAAAADLGLPVALNTRDRDQKLRADAVRSKLKPFLKSGAPRTLDTKAGEAAAVKAKAALVHNGYDAIKLATDDSFLEKMMVQTRDPEKRAKLLEAAEVGRKHVTKRK